MYNKAIYHNIGGKSKVSESEIREPIQKRSIEKKEKIIESFSRGSAVDYEFGKWKFEKGVFVQKELLSHPPRESE